MKLLSTVILSFLFFAAPSQATLIPAGLDCDNGGVTATMGAIDCSGAWQGNDANQQTDVLAQLGLDFTPTIGSIGTWSFTDKADTGQNTAFFDSVPSASIGTITFDNPITNYFALALKASNQFSLYLFDGGLSGISSIDFSTLGSSVNGRGTEQTLSHASLYSFTGPTVVTVPEASPLLLLIIGLFVFVCRRIKKL